MDALTYVAEDGTTYSVGQGVRRVDFENDGTLPYEGFISRIEVNGDEVTYWITWEGAKTPDPHGPYAFEVADSVDMDEAFGYASEEHGVSLEDLADRFVWLGADGPERPGTEKIITPYGVLWLRAQD